MGTVTTVDRYRAIVRRLILDYARYKPSHGNIETEAVIDPAGNHFEVLHVGWDGPRRVHGTVIHVDIIGDKVWIQHDGTSPGIAVELVDAGIPRDAIVLGFRPPHVRQYSGFALA
jgi:XisI protein